AEPGDQPGAPLQASAVTPATVVPDDAVAEMQGMRRYYEQWLGQSGGRTTLGLTGVPPAGFEDVVRFLERFAAGEDKDFAGRPPAMPLPGFIGWGAADLKALYFGGALAMKPAAGGDDIARWFWAETAMGRLLRDVRARLDASDDPRWKAAAFGVAR